MCYGIWLSKSLKKRFNMELYKLILAAIPITQKYLFKNWLKWFAEPNKNVLP